MEFFNQYKKYWVTAGAVVVFLLCYQLALKKTIAAWQLNSRLQKQVDVNTDLSVQPAYLERQYQSVNLLAASYKVDTANYRTQLLGKLAAVADSCKVTLTNIPKSTTIADGRIVRQQIGAEGDFFSLLRFYSLIEKQAGLGMASSVAWKKAGDNGNVGKKGKDVELTVYFNGF